MPEVGRYGLPTEVVYCSRCTMSNQKLLSRPEHLVEAGAPIPTMHLDEDGVCDACREAERQQTEVDWDARYAELEKLCDQHRSKDGSFDCIVPGSGGKDSMRATRILTDLGMHPLTCTWPPFMYTDYGYRNWQRWTLKHPNVVVKPSGDVHALLTSLAIENLLSPFQPFYFGQKNLAPKIAVQYNVPLVFYGEPESNYQTNTQNTDSLRKQSFYAHDPALYKNLRFGGLTTEELEARHHITRADLTPYLPASPADIVRAGVEVRYLGWYVPWPPQEAYYEAVEHYGFEARPFRTEGTFSKYNSIDDKIEDLNHYALYCKTGLGRASYDSAQEVRNGHLSREEAVALVKRYDGEKPQVYTEEVLAMVGMIPERFFELCESAKPEHLFENGEIRHPIWGRVELDVHKSVLM